jgi:anaerobic sulfite reductase subunit B
MDNIYLPMRSKILKIEKHTDIDYTFRMEYRGLAKPGQFFMISIPKFGEAPISISEIGENYLDFTIRRVGTVTDEIHELKMGQYLFIRGPYGNGFDIDFYKDKEVVVAVGGTGLAPVKGVVDYFAANPGESKSFTLIKGFKSPEDILFRENIELWKKTIKTILTVDKAPEGYKGNSGLITNYIKDIEFKDVETAQVIVVGPPIMMKFTVLEFLKRGVKEENIWVSYERRMSCGVGKCGHCKIDDTYICLDGPVFNFTKAKYLID